MVIQYFFFSFLTPSLEDVGIHGTPYNMQESALFHAIYIGFFSCCLQHHFEFKSCFSPILAVNQGYRMPTLTLT